MNIPEMVAKARFIYHSNALDVNNVLNQLGLRDDEKAEEAGKKHTMTIFTDILPRLGYDVDKFLSKEDRT